MSSTASNRDARSGTLGVMPHVDANYHFIAASNEVNARITQRQQTLALYITLVLRADRGWWACTAVATRCARRCRAWR